MEFLEWAFEIHPGRTGPHDYGMAGEKVLCLVDMQRDAQAAEEEVERIPCHHLHTLQVRVLSGHRSQMKGREKALSARTAAAGKSW